MISSILRFSPSFWFSSFAHIIFHDDCYDDILIIFTLLLFSLLLMFSLSSSLFDALFYDFRWCFIIFFFIIILLLPLMLITMFSRLIIFRFRLSLFHYFLSYCLFHADKIFWYAAILYAWYFHCLYWFHYLSYAALFAVYFNTIIIFWLPYHYFFHATFMRHATIFSPYFTFYYYAIIYFDYFILFMLFATLFHYCLLMLTDYFLMLLSIPSLFSLSHWIRLFIITFIIRHYYVYYFRIFHIHYYAFVYFIITLINFRLRFIYYWLIIISILHFLMPFSFYFIFDSHYFRHIYFH